MGGGHPKSNGFWVTQWFDNPLKQIFSSNVTLLPPDQSNGFGPAFTFDITPRHTKEMRNIYIKCSIGLCSSIKGFGNFAEVCFIFNLLNSK